MNERQCIIDYCRAQTQLNTIDADVKEKRKSALKNLKSRREELQSDMLHHGLLCVATSNAKGELSYVRVQNQKAQYKLDVDGILEIAKEITIEDLKRVSTKNESIFSKMFCDLLKQSIQKKALSQATKPVLRINTNKEKGHDALTLVPTSIQSLLKEFLHAHSELESIHVDTNTQKQKALEEQKSVADQVESTLKTLDPLHSTQKVSIKHGDTLKTFYLQRREKEIVAPLRLQRAISSAHAATLQSLKEMNLDTRFSPTVKLNDAFFDCFRKNFKQELEDTAPASVRKVKLCMIRGSKREEV